MPRKTKKTKASPDRTKGLCGGGARRRHRCRAACSERLPAAHRGSEAAGHRVRSGAAERAFGFFESKLRLGEGQFEDKPFQLAAAQAFIIGSIFGWKRPDGTRRFRRAYVEQGKGNGKSPLAGGIGLYGLTFDDEAGAEIYSAGATKDQAGILFRDAVKMVGKSPSLERRLKMSGGPGREFNIAYLKNSSFFRPVSRETKKTGSGPRPHFALVDELHEHADAGIIEILERGFKFRRQPLLLMITNSGSDRNSVCWTEHEHAVRVAAGNLDAKDDDAHYLGEVLDDTSFSYVCARSRTTTRSTTRRAGSRRTRWSTSRSPMSTLLALSHKPRRCRAS
jgi:phage terminase large subunit-like protein